MWPADARLLPWATATAGMIGGSETVPLPNTTQHVQMPPTRCERLRDVAEGVGSAVMSIVGRPIVAQPAWGIILILIISFLQLLILIIGFLVF
jgi:hypothetical protein